MVDSEECGLTSIQRCDRVENESGWSLKVTGSVGSRWKKKWVAPECNCGIYAILFMSGTDMNPNRLFFRCSYFKVGLLTIKILFILFSIDAHTSR